MIKIRPAVAVLGAVAAVSLAACGDGGASSTALSVPASTPAGAAGAAGADGAYPVTVESCGRAFTYETSPKRIVAGHPTSIATLVALGVGDRVVGWTGGSLGPAPTGVPNAREVSDAYQAPREAVLAARPDLFFTNDENQVGGESGGLGYGDLEQAGAGVYVLGEYCIKAPGASGIDIVYQDVANMSRLLGVPARGAALVDEMKQRVAAAGGMSAGRPRAKAAFVQAFDGKLYALTGSYYKMILDNIGIGSVFDSLGLTGNFSEISPEQVLRLAPDALFVIYDAESTKDAQLKEAKSLLADSPAVRDGRVVGLLNATTSAGGVSLIEAVEQAARGAFS